MSKKRASVFVAAAAFGMIAAGSATAQGAGASVDWELFPGDGPVTVFDAPNGYDKHYRVCFQDVPEVGKLEVILSDRRITITREHCIDVVSNRVLLQVSDVETPQQGIFYLVE